MENTEQTVVNKVENKVEDKVEDKIAENVATSSSGDNTNHQSTILSDENDDNSDDIGQTIITLDRVVNQCRAALAHDISQEEFVDFCNHIAVRAYLPLSSKTLLINNIVTQLNFFNLDNAVLAAEDLELYKVFILLLAYSNIDANNYRNLWTEDVYDLLQLTIVPAMLVTCQADFTHALDMLQNAITIDNIINVLYISSVSPQKVNITEDLNHAMQELSNAQDLLKQMNITN